MEQLARVLYLVSTGLLIPVMVGLLGLTAWALLELGGFLREWFARRRARIYWEAFAAVLEAKDARAQQSVARTFFDNTVYPGFLRVFAERGRRVADNPIHLGRLVAQVELDAEAELARMTFGVRLGPILGLMGTLIPLGPALVGLASGDVETLARNLVVAFSTTVLGLFVGAICYVLSLVRRKWYARDLAEVDYLYQCLFGSGTDDEAIESVRGSAPLASPSTVENAG